MCVVLARYKKQGGLSAYWQTMSVHEVGVDAAAVTVHSLRPDTTYRFQTRPTGSRHDLQVPNTTYGFRTRPTGSEHDLQVPGDVAQSARRQGTLQ